MRKTILLLFLCPGFMVYGGHPLFTPPNGWKVADPKHYAPSVHICFMHPKKQRVSPSINLSIEKDVGSVEEYLEAVRTLYASKEERRWRRLGKVQAQGTHGVLTEIDTTSNGHPIRMLQCIFVSDGTAYILTAACLKKVFSKHYPRFLEIFKSFTISENLLECIQDPTRQKALRMQLTNLQKRKGEKEFEKNVWKPFEKMITQTYEEMGPYWQILILKQAKESL